MPKVGHELKRWREVSQGVHRSVVRANCSIVLSQAGSVAVKLDGVRLERSRSFGAVWLGWILWRALKLDEQCGALLASKRETVAMGGGDRPIGDCAAVRAVKRAARGRAAGIAPRRLRTCLGWQWRNAKKLPFTRKLGPKMLRFSSAGIQTYLAVRKIC